MNNKVIILAAVFVAVMVGFSVFIMDIAANGKSTTIILPVIATKLVKIEGMTCESCEKTLGAAAKKIKGVISIKASAASGEAIVKYDLIQTDIKSVMKEIRKTGYRPISFSEYNASKESH